MVFVAWSNTGLLTARVHPVYKTRPKKIELSGIYKPAPFTLRPFAGIFNPFPYGCSVLCNHPADGEAKEFVKRAKESWASEGRAILLPAEMEMIRATLLAGGIQDTKAIDQRVNPTVEANTTSVPEELFRKYTETDSRPLTPTPTLASGAHPIQPEDYLTCHPRERTTLVLDLRTSSQDHESETFSWHALTLEPPPSPKKAPDYFKPIHHTQQQPAPPPPPPSLQSNLPMIQQSDQNCLKNEKNDEEESDDLAETTMIKRRGKRLKKRKCRRGSTYGQQNEVKDPMEPLETQVSQVEDASRRNSSLVADDNAEKRNSPCEQSAMLKGQNSPVSSFISPDILKYLARELDRETVEEEFSLKRRIALEEALRTKETWNQSAVKPARQTIKVSSQNTLRIFSRQNARFELVDSSSLSWMKPLDYLSKHVFITPGSKLIYSRIFNKYYEDSLNGVRHIFPNDLMEGIQEVMGKPLTDEQHENFHKIFDEIKEPLNFRSWCGVAATCERLLGFLSPREIDPPSWIEIADFSALHRRLKDITPDPKLVNLLEQICDR